MFFGLNIFNIYIYEYNNMVVWHVQSLFFILTTFHRDLKYFIN